MILDIRMRDRSPVSTDPAWTEGTLELFASACQKPARIWFPLAWSLAIHAFLISGAVYYSDSLRQTVESVTAKYTVRYLRLSAAAPPRSSARRAGEGSPLVADFESRQAGKAGNTSRSTDTQEGQVLRLPDEDRRPAHRVIEFPKLPLKPPPGQVLLQPNLLPVPVLKRDLRMPELLIWRPQPPQPAAPARKIFVAQKLQTAVAQLRNLPAPPALNPPNREMKLADMTFSGGSSNANSPLVRPSGTTVPMRAAGQGESSPIPQIPPIASTDSSALNILSIPEVPLPPRGVFEVAPGNQAPVFGESSAGAGGSGHSPGSGGGGANSGTISPVSGNGSGRTPGTEPGPGGGGSTGSATSGSAGRPSTLSGADGRGAEAGSGSGSPGHGFGSGSMDAGRAAAAGTSPDARAAPSRTVTTVVHPPDGHFSVLVESSGSEGFAEAEGVLSGRVVYTVYVRAGAGKEWILQYCLPPAVEDTLPVTGKAAPLEAPFPYVILKPDLAFGPDIDYLIIHGTVTALGRLDQLSYVIAPEEQTEKDVLLHSLQQWQFRPGKLDGQPIALEILLIVPRDRE